MSTLASLWILASLTTMLCSLLLMSGMSPLLKSQVWILRRLLRIRIMLLMRLLILIKMLLRMLIEIWIRILMRMLKGILIKMSMIMLIGLLL